MKAGVVIVLLIVAGCGYETISHTASREDTDDSPPSCGGTGGLCNVACSNDLDCLDYSDLAVCNEAGMCEARAGCMTYDACGPEARCSSWFEACAPLGDKGLDQPCQHAAECRSGACAEICVTPCFANRDCAPTQRCTIIDTYYGDVHGYCQVSAVCDACDGEMNICDPIEGTCAPNCRTTADCEGGDCRAPDDDDPQWSCTSEEATCPPNAFLFQGTCFTHRACVLDEDCEAGSSCRPPREGFVGGYCSPQEVR